MTPKATKESFASSPVPNLRMSARSGRLLNIRHVLSVTWHVNRRRPFASPIEPPVAKPARARQPDTQPLRARSPERSSFQAAGATAEGAGRTIAANSLARESSPGRG